MKDEWRIRFAEQKMFHNGNRLKIEVRFNRKIYIKSNIISKFVCQMINYFTFQMVICYIVILIVGVNRYKKRGVVDYMYLASIQNLILLQISYKSRCQVKQILLSRTTVYNHEGR